MDDVEPVERGHSSSKPGADFDPARDRQRCALEPGLKRFARIMRHGDVKSTLPLGGELDRASDKGIVDPRADQRLARERQPRAMFGEQRRLGKFKNEGPAVGLVDRPEQTGVKPVGNLLFETEAVDDIADGRRRFDRQPVGERGKRIRLDCGQSDHVDHQRGDIILRSGRSGGVDDRLRIGFGRMAFGENSGDRFVAEHAMDSIAGEQQAVVERKFALAAVEPKVGLDPDRAVKNVALVGGGKDMILGHPAKLAFAEMPGAAVPDMKRGRPSAAQHQRGEGCRGAFEIGVDSPDPVKPAVEAKDRAAAGGGDTDRLGLAIIAVDEAAHGEFGGEAAALGAADPVGDCGDDSHSQTLALGAEIDRAIILIFRPPTTDRREPRRDVEPAVRPHVPFPSHSFSSPSATDASPQCVSRSQ